MKKNSMYTYLAQRLSGTTVLGYDLFYVVDLEPGAFTKEITPGNDTPGTGEYTVHFNPTQEKHSITLIYTRNGTADQVPRDGKIFITGMVNPMKLQRIEFRLQDASGPVGGQGKSTPHYGDAD
jgi:hypothetical protein